MCVLSVPHFLHLCVCHFATNALVCVIFRFCDPLTPTSFLMRMPVHSISVSCFYWSIVLTERVVLPFLEAAFEALAQRT